MANAKISDNSVFIPKSDILDVVGLAGYDSSGNVKISGANLKASVLSGSITTITGTAPISVTSGSTPVVSISQATTSTNGFLSSTDWNTFNDKTGNLGTVTTVSASISGSAYTATVTNATTTPSISIAPQGSSSQYINGAGNLTTFPTLPTVNNNTITLSPGTGLSGGGDFTLNQPSDKTITFTNTITNNNQLTNGAGYITSSSLPTVGDGKLTITVDGTATEFTANQSGDTNLSFTTGTSIPVSDEGTQITSGVTSLDFVGAGVTASASGNDVTVTITGGGGSGGTVTNVSALTLGTTGTDLSSTVANSTTTPVITLNVPSASASNRGALTSTDWTTFNNKTDNTGTVTQIIASSPLTGGTITSSGTIGIPQANTSDSGYLTSTDWNTFNNKTAFAEPAIFSGGGSPSLATGVTGLEIRTLIGAGVGDGIVTSLTTTGTSGVATLNSGVLNIPNYATGSGSSPSAPVNSIQFNNAGSFGGSSNLTYSSDTLTVQDNIIIKGDGSTDASKLTFNCYNNNHYVGVIGPDHINSPVSYDIKLPNKIATQSAYSSNGRILEVDANGDGQWIATPTGGGSGTVTDVTVSAPLTVANGTTTPALNITQSDTNTDGYLSSTDWNTFNSKGSGTVTGVTGTAPVSVTSGNTPVVSMSAASGSTNGYLTSTDWTTFNSKSNFSGAYADLTGKPTIPTNNNQLTNGAGYITSASLPTVNDGQLTITVDGTATTFTANQSGDSSVSITTGSSDNFYVTGASYSAGTLTLTRNGGLADVTATGFLQIGTSSTTALAGDTTTITTAQANEITANTAKVGITTAQANEITANTAKVGITTAQANEITANTAKVGITTQQASDITANNAKVSANNTTVTIAAGTGLTGGGSFTTNQSGASTITLNASGGSGGGFPSAVTASSTAATSAAVDTFYTITTTSGVADIVVTLPTAASNSGKIIGVKYAAQNSVDDTVVIKTISSQTIDGTNRTTNGLPLASIGTYYEVISDGSNWWIK